MELSDDSDTDTVTKKHAPKLSALPVSAVLLCFGNSMLINLEQVDIGKRLADALKELDASKKKIGRYEAANSCKRCAEIMWQPCM